VRKKFRCGSDSWRGFHAKDFRRLQNFIVICCVNNTTAVSARDEKSIPALKVDIFYDIADSIPYLVPTQIQESIFCHKTRQKIPAQSGRRGQLHRTSHSPL
jgi:hypothetical protein